VRAGSKSRAAAFSIASNTLLIAAKLAAAAITGSIAILTEVIHSSIDLIASVIAFVSVRKADEPADDDHLYGHEKVESLAAVIEGVLILLGAAIIVFEATRRLVTSVEIDSVGVGIAIVAGSVLVNGTVSEYLRRQADRLQSPALAGDAAHLRADAVTSLGVVAGLVLVRLTGNSIFDPIAALVVAVAIVFAGFRIITRSSGPLVDEAPPADEMRQIEAAIAAASAPEVAGYHKLRARRAGRRRYIDLHVQFTEGTTLERAHELAHLMRDEIESEIPDADVLIHVEPEKTPGSVR
jgi:cation diffusion facilitator family transporter